MNNANSIEQDSFRSISKEARRREDISVMNNANSIEQEISRRSMTAIDDHVKKARKVPSKYIDFEQRDENFEQSSNGGSVDKRTSVNI